MEDLSDVGLYKEYVRKNFPTLPVTETTRNIMFKKMNAKKSKSSASANADPYVRDASTQNVMWDRQEWETFDTSQFFKDDRNVAQKSSTYASGKNHIITGRNTYSKNFGALEYTDVQRFRKDNILSKTKDDHNSDDDISGLRYTPHYRGFDNSPSSRPPISTYGNEKKLVSNFEAVKRLFRPLNTTLLSRKPQTEQNKKIVANANRSLTTSQNNFKVSYKANASFFRTLIAKSILWLKDQNQNKPTFISYALISTLFIFLVVVSCMYLFIVPKSFLSREHSIKYHLCSELGMMTTSKSDLHICIEESKLANVILLNPELAKILQQHGKRYKCIDNPEHSATSLTHFINKDATVVAIQNFIANLNSPMYIVKCNLQQKLESGGVTVSTEYTKKLGQNQQTTFVQLKPHVSLVSTFKNKLQRTFFIIGIGSLIVALALICYNAVKYFQQRLINRKLAIENLISDIIYELKFCSSFNEGKDYEIAVNELRDKLIPLDKRSTLLKLWNEALRILETSENRVQFRVSICNNEELCTIKWIGNTTTTAEQKSQPGAKKWQSPAFKNVNKIAHPPTECLKIRNMFDSTETAQPNLKRDLAQSISAKVGLSCNICDIQLDIRSCCVYVRCATEKDAGLIHNELNGWWFDKRLVSIKFLRLERYLSRFPGSSPKAISG